MKRRTFISAGAIGATVASTIAPLASAAPAVAAQPSGLQRPEYPGNRSTPPLAHANGPSGGFDVGLRAQLFIDRHVIHTTDGISFSQHAATKHPLNPLIKADRPWEGWKAHVYGTVLFDEEEGRFKMWYQGTPNQWFPKFATFYATSQDGLHWEKPPIGTIKVKDLAAHNAVLEGVQINSVFKDPADADPARRYKMIEWTHRASSVRGGHLHVSPDGLKWTQVSKEPLFYSGDVMTAFYDPVRKLYGAIPKIYTPVGSATRRCFGITTTQDLLKWPEPQVVFLPDRRDDAGTLARLHPSRELLDVPIDPKTMRTEFYGVGTYRAESCMVGFPWVFSINGNARFPSASERKGQDGTIEVQLASSRDLFAWDRPFRTPIIPLGKPGEWDCGMMSTASHAFRHKDEVWLYYGGRNYSHGVPAIYPEYKGNERGTKYHGGIGLAKWRLDRFVSADGGSEGGTLTTVPLHVAGRRLELNVDATRGSVTVDVLDASGNPIAGLGRSDAITSDSLRATVTWQGKQDISAIADQAVCLRIALKSAKLFSFAFRA